MTIYSLSSYLSYIPQKSIYTHCHQFLPSYSLEPCQPSFHPTTSLKQLMYQWLLLLTSINPQSSSYLTFSNIWQHDCFLLLELLSSCGFRASHFSVPLQLLGLLTDLFWKKSPRVSSLDFTFSWWSVLLVSFSFITSNKYTLSTAYFSSSGLSQLQTHLSVYSRSPLGYITDISNLTCPSLNSCSFPHTQIQSVSQFLGVIHQGSPSFWVLQPFWGMAQWRQVRNRAYRICGSFGVGGMEVEGQLGGQQRLVHKGKEREEK